MRQQSIRIANCRSGQFLRCNDGTNASDVERDRIKMQPYENDRKTARSTIDDPPGSTIRQDQRSAMIESLGTICLIA